MKDENRNISETPERWVIVKISTNDEEIFKVFGTWAGGYLDVDRWRLNSGIVSVEQDDNFYYFFGYSGSCYKCHKKGYGVASSFGRGVLSDIVEKSNGKLIVIDEIPLDVLNCI